VSLHAAFIPRPSHADYTYLSKYGVSASSGGGRASARETVARVAAGAVAELILRRLAGVSIVAYVSQVGRASLIRDAIRARRGHARAAGGETAVAAADINDEGWDGVDGWREHDLNSGSDVGDESGDDDEGADQKPANVDTGARARAARPTRRLTRAEVDATAVRCPRLATAAKMEREIKRAAAANVRIRSSLRLIFTPNPHSCSRFCFFLYFFL
jgi:chorismate synthase